MADLTQDALVGGGGAALAIAVFKAAEALISRWPALIGKRRAEPSERAAVAAADLIELAMQGAGTSVQQLLAEVGRLSAQCSAQARELAELKEAHADCEARTLSLEGQLNTRGQQLESLARWFRANGMEVPDLTGARPLIILQPNLPGVPS